MILPSVALSARGVVVVILVNENCFKSTLRQKYSLLPFVTKNRFVVVIIIVVIVFGCKACCHCRMILNAVSPSSNNDHHKSCVWFSLVFYRSYQFTL
jgi:hypothetical protein